MIRRTLLTVTLGAGLSACANAPIEDDAGLGQMGKIDGFVAPPGDAFVFRPPTDMGVDPPNDARIPIPPTDGGGPPPADAFRPPPPDMGGVEPGDPLVVSVAVTEQPQADSSSLSAAVALPTDLMSVPGCTVIDANPNAVPPAPPSFDAGAITVTGANGGPYTLVLAPGGQYSSPNTPDDLFNDATALQAQAVGGAHVGAFQLMVPAPAQVRMSNPPEFSFESTPANQDLSVRWSGGTSESLVVTAFPVGSAFDLTPRAGRWVVCSGADNGNLVIPGAQLSQVGSGGTSVLVAITRTRISSSSIGVHEAFFSASTSTAGLITLD